ncbi:MAG: hypothetical protein JEY94_18615 [Melioribacteraceae bacterium]|nr:hypothetical protein [Melioribacteraceae bacterium]
MDKSIQNNKLQILGKMAASLAHEIRNPLSALKLNLNFLNMSDEQLDDDSKECLSACMESVDRINYLIETTLDFSRKSSENLMQDSLNDIILKALEFFGNNAKRKCVEISLNLEEKIPHIPLNRNAALQIILNLLNNAVDACYEGGKVNVKTYKAVENNNVILEIGDNGVGIKDTEIENIFDDFYTSKRTGTGLGLGVCKRLLNELNAEITLTSKEGIGTNFFIKFPLTTVEELYET